jgi:hypothetical protein
MRSKKKKERNRKGQRRKRERRKQRDKGGKSHLVRPTKFPQAVKILTLCGKCPIRISAGTTHYPDFDFFRKMPM